MRDLALLLRNCRPIWGYHSAAPAPSTMACSKCCDVLPVTEFYEYTDGRGRRRRKAKCKRCFIADVSERAKRG